MADIRKELTKKYSFPSVNVTEIVRSPSRQDVEWRTTIGVAAPFSKGPKLARVSANRKELIALFGEDQSIGSLFIQQAMLQGASDFVISRVLPENKAATGTVSITPANNITYTEAKVNEYGERTVGLKFNSTLISKFQPSPGTYLGDQSTENNTRDLTIYTNSNESPLIQLDGVGYFDLEGFEVVSIADLIAQNVLSAARQFKVVDLALGDGIFKIKFASDATSVGVQENELNELIRSIKPGLVLTAGSDLTITNSELEILSYVTDLGNGEFEVLVKGEITSLGVDADKTFIVGAKAGAVTGSYTVVGVKYRGTLGTTLPGAPVLPNAGYISYLLAPHKTQGGVMLPIKYYSIESNNIVEVSTGIKVAFGSSTGVNTVRTSAKLNGTITFFNSTVELGETDESDPSFPNTAKSFAPGTSILEIYSNLQSEMLNTEALSSIFADIEINSSSLPYSLSFNLQNKSTLGNDVMYSVELVKSNASADDLNIVIDGADGDGVMQNMVGGIDGVKAADTTFYDFRGNAVLYVQAISPGVFGNNIIVSVKPVRDGEFILEAYDANNSTNATVLPSESYYLSNISADAETGVYSETLTSNLIRAYFIPLITNTSNLPATVYNQTPTRLAPPDYTVTSPEDLNVVTHPNHRGESFLQNIRLSGGSEPTNYPPDSASFSAEDYIAAVDRLKEEDVCFICAPGVTAGDLKYNSVVDRLVEQAENSTPYEGLRIAVIATPPRMTASRARLIASRFNSERVVLVASHSRISGLAGNSTKLISSEGFYTGYVVNLPPHISPAAQVNGGLVGVVSLDTRYTLEELDELTKNNIEVLHLDPVTKVYKFLNGRTTSNSLAQRWSSIRRHADHLIMNLFRNLQWAKALPNDEDLRTKVASACDAFLKYEKSRGHITDFSPTITDETVNSPEDLVTGNLNILLRYIPKVPADYINLAVIRDFSTEFSLEGLNI